MGLTVSALSWAEPDEALLGKAQNYPVSDGNWGRSEHTRVGSWSALDRVPGVLTQKVAKSSVLQPLPRATAVPDLQYRYRNATYSLEEYLDRRRVTGLLILKDGQIVFERYRYGRSDDARFLSFSMAKSVTSLLMGVALDQGQVKSLDDVAATYVKELEGSAYGQTRLRDLLRMSSGVTFTERYDGRDDVSRLSGAVSSGWPSTLEVLRSFQDRHSPPGAKFVYASSETEVLGRVLTAATGRTLAELTEQWLWQPMGAEHEAFWCTGKDRQAAAYFCSMPACAIGDGWAPCWPATVGWAIDKSFLETTCWMRPTRRANRPPSGLTVRHLFSATATSFGCIPPRSARS